MILFSHSSPDATRPASRSAPGVSGKASGWIVLLLACASLVQGCQEHGTPRYSQSKVEPSLSSIQRHVFDTSCAVSGCHAGRTPESQLDLTAGRSYRSLVNVESSQISGLVRVLPGAADRSYLVRKLEGDRIVGEPMPSGDSPLPEEVIAAIREWIDSGAPEG